MKFKQPNSDIAQQLVGAKTPISQDSQPEKMPSTGAQNLLEIIQSSQNRPQKHLAMIEPKI